MTTEQIIAAIGCTEEQARELLGHVEGTTKVEAGSWSTTQSVAQYCPACKRNRWHDAGECIVCAAKIFEPLPPIYSRRTVREIED